MDIVLDPLQNKIVLADPGVNNFTQRLITQDNASQVLEAVYHCQLGIVNDDFWFYGVGIWHGLVKHFSLGSD